MSLQGFHSVIFITAPPIPSGVGCLALLVCIGGQSADHTFVQSITEEGIN